MLRARAFFVPLTRTLSTLPSLVGTVRFGHAHLFVCTGKDSWDSDIKKENAFINSLAHSAAESKFKLTACDAPNTSLREDEHSLMIFPHHLSLSSLKISDIPKVITLVNRFAPVFGEPSSGNRNQPNHFKDLQYSSSKTLEEVIPICGFDHENQIKYLDPDPSGKELKRFFVCTHMNRDKKCGIQGPQLVTELKKLGATHVYQVSHIGGHRFAGNVIVYPPGDWYGYLTPQILFEFYRDVQQDKIPKQYWRGRLGLTEAEQKDFHSKLPKDEFINLSIVDKMGDEQKVQGRVNYRLLTAGLENKIAIGGNCGGNMECGSCHVILQEDFAHLLPKPSVSEQDVLDTFGNQLTENSRLACQITLKKELDNMSVTIPTM